MVLRIGGRVVGDVRVNIFMPRVDEIKTTNSDPLAPFPHLYAAFSSSHALITFNIMIDRKA